MFFSVSIVVSLLASSAVALTTPHGHNARDMALPARHHHIARQVNGHPISRRSARRKRCLERNPLTSAASSSYSPAAVPTTSTEVVEVPVNIAPGPAPHTTTPAPVEPTTTAAPYTPPQPTTSSAPASPQPASSGETHSGDGTFFDVGLVRTFPLRQREIRRR